MLCLPDTVSPSGPLWWSTIVVVLAQACFLTLITRMKSVLLAIEMLILCHPVQPAGGGCLEDAPYSAMISFEVCMLIFSF